MDDEKRNNCADIASVESSSSFEKLDQEFEKVIAAIKEYLGASGMPRDNLAAVDKVIRDHALEQYRHMATLADIGVALSSESDMDKLLEMILVEAMSVTHADAGTLYLADHDNDDLHFTILRNNTLGSKQGGTSGNPVNLPPVPLVIDGLPNRANVSSYAALSKKVINIEDVYEAEGFDFTGPRKYDQATGYRSKSMLVIPMLNHEREVLGVLQLLNCTDQDSGETTAFARQTVQLAASLASQAAVALTNADLISSLKDLLNAFIKSIATAIDAKSPYTAGHISRVVDLSMMIAHEVNCQEIGPYSEVNFDSDEMEELRLAAWMHDVGKITTPEHVVDKSTKLQTIVDRIEHIETRFALIGQIIRGEYLDKKLSASPEEHPCLDTEMERELADLNRELEFVTRCNLPGEFMSDDKIQAIEDLSKKTYSVNGHGPLPYLTKDEVENLCIRKGSLTARERDIIEQHAVMTYRILNELPFPKKLAKVPDFACGHHEKLDGSGYPHGISGEKLPIQARILALADVFEALTAKDRPYKKPMPLSKVVEILGYMVKDGHIDPGLLDLFLKHGLHLKYASKELSPEQFDMEMPDC